MIEKGHPNLSDCTKPSVIFSENTASQTNPRYGQRSKTLMTQLVGGHPKLSDCMKPPVIFSENTASKTNLGKCDETIPDKSSDLEVT